MKESLQIALVQTDTVWEKIDHNLDNLSGQISRIDKDLDIIILPELFSTGFTLEAEKVAENMKGKAVKWMQQQASDRQSLIIGSVVIIESGLFFNRLIVAFPDGKLKYYDKRHLFSFAGEDKIFSPGEKRLIFDYKGFRICPLVCYDLRFPVWSRNTAQFDLLLYVANWPNARMYAWDTLLRARAIENLCYVIGVNRVGTDQNNLVYTGHSALCDAMGETLVDFEEGIKEVKLARLDKAHLEKVREKFSFLDDKDEFSFD